MELSVMALIGVVVRLSCQINYISDGAVWFVYAGNGGIVHAGTGCHSSVTFSTSMFSCRNSWADSWNLSAHSVVR